MLLEIWRSMRTSRLTPTHPQASHAMLPESPAIKDLLRHEVQLLLLNIQNKAHKEGRLSIPTDFAFLVWVWCRSLFSVLGVRMCDNV